MQLHHKEVISFPIQAVYNVVAAVEEYPEFLPWCRSVSFIGEKTVEEMTAELVVGYGFFQEVYRSKVRLQSPFLIEIDYIQGPFKFLHCRWHFTQINDQQTTVEFFIDFEFKSLLRQKLMERFFKTAVMQLMTAFKKRVVFKTYS